MTLIISALALVLSGLKIARLLYELAINQSIAFFTAVTDIASGQRLKKAIEMILGTFVILFSCFFLLQLYVIGSAYCNKNMDNVIVRLLALGALAWAVIDGPNLVERIVGIDAGINSAFKAITGTYMAGKTLGAISKGVRGFTRSATSKAVTAGATGAGVAGGIAGAYKATRQNKETNNQSPVTGLVPVSNNDKMAVSNAVSKKSNAQNYPSSIQKGSGANNFTSSSSSSYSPPKEHTNYQSPDSSERPSSNQTTADRQPNSATNSQQTKPQRLNNEYSGRTWKSKRVAQFKQSNAAKTYKRAYNLTQNGIVESYDKNMQKMKERGDKQRQKIVEKSIGNLYK